MIYSGVYVFGDSLVDAGNALKLAEWYGDLTFSDLPDGAPTPELGYFKGRFSDGYTFADLLANKEIGAVTKPVFPYGFEDPWLGIPVSPFAGDPSGNNLNFAYGGAQIRQGDEAVPDLDGQTDAFRNAVDGDADPNALYLITIGGNDVRNLAPSGSAPVSQADAHLALDKAAEKYLTELSQLVDMGAQHILITGVPNVGLIPKYDRQDPGEAGYDSLDALEMERSAAATEYSIYLDELIRTEVIPALEAMGATVTYVPLMDYIDSNGVLVKGALSANLPTIAALHGLTTEELSGNLLEHRELLFFDDIHPNGQANALLGAFMHAKLTGTEWIEILPLTGPEMNFTVNGVISVAGEVDKTVVSLVAGTTYTVEMLGMSSLGLAGSIGDGSLSILNPSGAALTQFAAKSGNDSGAGFDATFTFTAPTSGNYTFALSGVGALTGAYTLQAGVVGGTAMTQANTYVVNSAATGVIEGVGGFGDDVVKASVSYALGQGSEIEVLRTTNDKGKTAINLTGNEFGQDLIGNVGANVLEGKAGADTFTGGAGKDIFVLSKAAVANPGAANIDTITDYASGDVVDVTQILSVAAGTNVIADGWLRVTANRVQVDMDGGGDNWVTLSMINGGTGAVAIRYLSGGMVTSVSVNRTADSALKSTSAANSNSVLLGAVAAAGLMSMPATAQSSMASDDGLALLGSLSIAGSGIGNVAASEWSMRSALTGEIRESLEGGGGPLPLNVRADAAMRVPEGNALVAKEAAPPAAVTDLLRGTDVPAQGDLQARAALVAEAVVMPAADSAATPVAITVADEAKTHGEVARILVEALAGGGDNPLDALLDALPGNPQVGVATAIGASDGSVFAAFVSPSAVFAIEAMAVHIDAPPLA
jgi:hypothetical protein